MLCYVMLNIMLCYVTVPRRNMCFVLCGVLLSFSTSWLYPYPFGSCHWHGNDLIIDPVSTNRPELCIYIYTWWRHPMETFSALLALCAGNSLVPGEFPHKGQWRGALMFSLICTWTNSRVNNREAGDLRQHRAHYDFTVMESSIFLSKILRSVCDWSGT